MIDPNEMRDFRRDIDVNKDNLEEEWLLHPSLYLHYSCEYSKAFTKKEELKQKLEWISAKLDLDIRKDYKKYGFTSKPAEGGIKNTIITNKEYQEMLINYNKALSLFTTMTGVKTAFEHKKHALANLVALKIGGFYSEPRNIVKDIKQKQGVAGQQERKKALNEKLRNRRNK